MSTVQSLKNSVALPGIGSDKKQWRTVATCLIIFGQFVTQPTIKRTNDLARCGSKNHCERSLSRPAGHSSQKSARPGGLGREVGVLTSWNLHFPIANAKVVEESLRLTPQPSQNVTYFGYPFPHYKKITPKMTPRKIGGQTFTDHFPSCSWSFLG